MRTIKVGGVLLANPAGVAKRIWDYANRPMAVIHGGGIQITRVLKQLNIGTRFIDGLRVTDQRTLSALGSTLLGEVHTALVAEMQREGLPAIGLFGVVHAAMKSGPWGFVGTDVRVDVPTIRLAVTSGKIPVIPTLALGSDSLLNVNGDETAAAVAVALGCSELLFLTDVEGVLNADGSVLSESIGTGALLEASYVSGGMIPKLWAVKTALEGGVPTVRVGRTIFRSAG